MSNAAPIPRKAPAFATAADGKLDGPQLSSQHDSLPATLFLCHILRWLRQELFTQVSEDSHIFPVAQHFRPQTPAAQLPAPVLWPAGEISSLHHQSRESKVK